ncbi:phage baseplate assembly protein V [Shinella sp. H4-D48]|uniref:phage baseplate assembly protein V n=1 Tax=Shinella sp. H4-D48 TaxID=2925841 RepID=UPI001F53A96E|nr:phage baseplate assembly protein V [Shinella sp. H4-D48]UNK36571.1 phage baseplate assembly protein V [Shinella sp. H4-D48]
MIPDNLPDQIANIYGRLAEIERRGRNRKRTGKVAEVGTGDNAGKYRVKLGEQGGKPYLTPWIRPRTLGAGGVKIDVILSAGEQVDVHSESGDLADATIDLSTYSEENARENADVPFHIKIGDTVIGASGEAISMNGATMTLTASNGHLA